MTSKNTTSSIQTRSAVRIFVLRAERADEAVIFRRGPSKQVLQIKWNLRNDTLAYGQWFKGRIYERRCDLSPSGDLLLYFAATFKGPLQSWTAISRPPFFTALALWPKGDAWGGGGVFESDRAVQLNHWPGQDNLAPGFTLKKGVWVKPFGQCPGAGEDYPLYDALLSKNGWRLMDAGEQADDDWGGPVTWVYKKPRLYEKLSKDGRRLHMQIKGIDQRNEAWYWIDYAVWDNAGKLLFELPKTDWADWHHGDLLFARGGKLFRLKKKNFGMAGGKTPALVADLNGLKFESKPPTRQAQVW